MICGGKRASYGSLAEARRSCRRPKASSSSRGGVDGHRQTDAAASTHGEDHRPRRVRDRRQAARPADRGGGASAHVRRHGESSTRAARKPCPACRGSSRSPRASPSSPTTSGPPSGAATSSGRVGAGPHAGTDTEELRASYRAQSKTAGAQAKTEGDAGKALGQRRPLVAEYALPYLAHAPWSRSTARCTARPRAARCGRGRSSRPSTSSGWSDLRMKPEQVTIHTVFRRRLRPAGEHRLGFRHRGGAGGQGAGRPVKTVWTREDDIRGGYYRPMAVPPGRGARRQGRAGRLAQRSCRNRSWPARPSPA